MRIIERRIVGTMVFSAEDKWLVALSAPGQTYEGCWKLPGGGIDEGETLEQAAIREVMEETGIDISGAPVELIDDKQGAAKAEKTLKDTGERVMVNMEFLTCKAVLDKPAAEIEVSLDPQEFSAYKWIDAIELKNLELSPPGREVYQRLGYL